MKKLLKELSLAFLYPKLSKEWDYESNYPLRPEDVFANSHKKFGWICEEGHKYSAAPHSRNSKSSGTGCPYCSGRLARKDNCLAVLNPEVAKLWHPTKNTNLTPSDVTCDSHRDVVWICENNHEWILSVREQNRKQKCPKCNSFAFEHPDLAKEWHPTKNGKLTPWDVTSGSSKKIVCICDAGHEYISSPNFRSIGRKCPYCFGYKVCEDNCLATTHPELSAEWDYEKNYPLTPKDVSQWNSKRFQWVCEKGHSYDATAIRRVAGDGCPYCSGNRVCIDNCLATKDPKLAKEWHPTKNGKLTPYDVSCGTNTIATWQCGKCNFVWAARINQRTDKRHGRNCPSCSGLVVSDKNRLSIISPELASEWHPTKNGKLTPYDVKYNSSKKAYWKCKKCGQVWIMRILNRIIGCGCPACHGIKLKNGIICDSLPEAYYCLKLCEKGIQFKHHIKIGLGKHSCDFYIPSINTYIETTGFTKKWTHWETYCASILKKKKHITRKLKARFRLIRLKLTRKQIQYVRENIA